MDPNSLIPSPDTIPAPSWVFILLEQLLFLLHIIVINAALGGAIITLVKRFKMKDEEYTALYKPAAVKLPILIALGINFAIPPLLFLQVVFGNLFYSSSVLMAVYWIMIIPLLVIAYYGFYIHSAKLTSSPRFSKAAIACSILIMLYIGLMLVTNNSLMVQPEKWSAYFENRGGTILNFSDPAIFPRYLHFITASIAVGSLFFAFIYKFKKHENSEVLIKNSLKIFAIATSFQVLVGTWYLLAIPSEFIPNFMGKDIVSSLVLLIGFLFGIISIIVAFKGNFNLTIITLFITMVAMITTRHNLRMMYLEDNFTLNQLILVPQYGVLALFLFVLLLGLVAIGYMLKIGFPKTNGEAV
ncbi:MAG: hypothetical protein JEY94_05065 [Melioribacteraceae bacterium]|nr:hypothetical protein [Melioribacteraceae bacterium]